MADSLKVPDTEIPLPPAEMWPELDNSGPAAPPEAPAPGSEPAAPQAAAARPEVAELEFIGAPPWRDVSLSYPFRWGGQEVRVIRVRRLSVAAMGAFYDGLPADGRYERTDLYGAMCGLPGAVIRALPDPDGPAVTGACFDFLPLALRAGASD